MCFTLLFYATLEERVIIAHCTRNGMEGIMAEMIFKRALTHQTPSSADKFYQPGDKALVWSLQVVHHRIGAWLGYFEIFSTDKERKLVYVRDANIRAASPFNISQVKRSAK